MAVEKAAAARLSFWVLTTIPVPPPIKTLVIDALAHSISTVFLMAVPLTFIAFLLALALPERPLRTTAHVGVEAVAGEPVLADVEEAAIEADELPTG